MASSTARNPSGRGKLSESARAARREIGSPTGLIDIPAHLVVLANRLGRRVNDLAVTIHPDVRRRLKYPYHMEERPDGSRAYTHDLQITDGPLSR